MSEVMETVAEIIDRLMADVERSVDDALSKKMSYEKKQFNWVRANPIYRG
jgi:hypothetical protein